MKIYALVGKSGTGKSYKALEIACENNIDYIIDDGILIHNGNVIEGISAKQAATKIEAVKRAIFSNKDHKNKVRIKINNENIKKILILGTSVKMVNQIAERLDLGRVDEYIRIEQISTKEDIENALKSRKKGEHIIPVPTVQIKPMVSGISINPLRRFVVTSDNKKMLLEKTIIRPAFSYIGKFYISPKVIIQIIKYEAINNKYVSKVNSIDVKDKNNNIDIFININVTDDLEVFKNLKKLQINIKNNIEQMTMINVDKVDIYIKKIK